QYQYQLTLNGDGAGKADTLEIWRNDTPENITFDPIFTDAPETKISSQVFDATGFNTTPLARGVPATDGSMFRARPTWVVDIAFPISTLVNNGVVTSGADLTRALFFPVTASVPNKHNKDWLNCQFVPPSTIAVDESVAPASVTSNVTTPVTYTIAVHATG